MRKIAIYNTSLSMGGISKSLINLLCADALVDYWIDVYLLTDNCEFEKPSFPSNIHIIYLKRLHKNWHKIVPYQRLRLPYECGTEYDVVIDYNGYSNECAYAALNTKGQKHIIWIHNDYAKRYQYNYKFKWLWRMSKAKFGAFDEYVAVSKGAKDAFLTMYPNYNKKIWVIPNLINTKEIYQKASVCCELDVNAQCYNLVSVGALTKNKNVEKQIQVMRETSRGDVRLYLIGDGPERSKLERLVKKYKLEQKVYFLGRQSNPYKYMSKMDGLIFTSLYEGQGMVVREAQALGLDLFIEQSLADYNEGVQVVGELTVALSQAKKHKKVPNDLNQYNQDIAKKINEIL